MLLYKRQVREDLVMIYELTPVYDSRKSFYRKAIVREINKVKVLYSYETEVCTINNGEIVLNDNVRSDLLFSQTTLRHIKEFIAQELGIHGLTKKQLMEWCY